ncbi:DUF1642 domain-containing protein [Enterococcus faecium]|uniref:DUF1642 domain-containing protein n=1 Tax=Enterococcus faecium TaxID=1352 RepID=UPI00338E7561
MNKQELKQLILATDYAGTTVSKEFKKGFREGMKISADMLEQLDEPQKPVVPKFVADWIELCKEKADLISCLSGSYEYGVNQYKRITEDEDWLFEADHQELVARAWLYGYEIEKEPLWAIKNANGNYLTKCALWGTDGVNHSFECNPSYQLLFTDKATADAAALLVNGTVEEVAER